jgi:hypothetical protein
LLKPSASDLGETRELTGGSLKERVKSFICVQALPCFAWKNGEFIPHLGEAGATWALVVAIAAFSSLEELRVCDAAGLVVRGDADEDRHPVANCC